jgi:MinD superfamily P-loop ATPase
MRKIAVTGGKGGTGKSTFSVLYSLKLASEGKKVVLCDADVECPNDHLLFRKKLEKGKPIKLEFPELDQEKCRQCGRCAHACTRNAIFWTKGKPPLFFDELCDACGACFVACPAKAIKGKKKEMGKIFENKINPRLKLVSGQSAPDLAETSQIVNHTKEFAEKKAEKWKADYLIVDTAAGMHCSVISALEGAEKIYGVTEPTPLGEHDLGLMLELITLMKAPAEIVLNKSTIGDKRLIYRLAEKFKVKVGKEIPYSLKVIEAYSKGKLSKLEGLV